MSNTSDVHFGVLPNWAVMSPKKFAAKDKFRPPALAEKYLFHKVVGSSNSLRSASEMTPASSLG